MGIRVNYNLTIETAKQVYNWFFHAFGTENNPKCTQEDINLKNELEKWLVNHGE